MREITINLINGKQVTLNQGETYIKLLEEQLNKDIIGLIVNKELVNPNTLAEDGALVEFIERTSIIGEKIYQAGIKFLTEVALKEEFGKTYKIKYNHSLGDGIHASIKGPTPFTSKDIYRLKMAMTKIVNQKEFINKINVEKSEAITYYESHEDSIKAQNIHNVSNDIIKLYKLKDQINYFYIEMPYNTKTLDVFDVHYLEENEIVIITSKKELARKEPTYVSYTKIIKNYKNNYYWLSKHNIKYLSDINKLATEYKIKDLVKSSEIFFNINLQKVVEDIIMKQSKYIMIAGPSSSGKTTTTKKISLILKSLGYNPFMISVDDYFIDRDQTPTDEYGNPDFECLEAIDTKLLSQQLNDLMNNKEVKMPTFDFVRGKKVYEKTVTLPPKSIILMEGLHCLNDELTPTIPKSSKYKIYLSPFLSLKVDDQNYISSTDLRIIRRIIRDKRTRNKDVEFTIKYVETLRQGEEKYIYPHVDKANIVINTSIAYELGVLKVYVEPLLYSVKMDSPYFEEARRLIKFLNNFFAIPSEYIPEDSILREFIGGSSFE